MNIKIMWLAVSLIQPLVLREHVYVDRGTWEVKYIHKLIVNVK